MSAIVHTTNFGILGTGDYLVTKGAPEVISNLLLNKPKNYETWINYYASEGY